ncbi:MerR family transcriptional regulator [Streptomyces mirabilis]|uniref:MerR family transcriptional regulator n=1 Tax=Streptomyces mirabilis TaxID=68239 RepID=UPI003321A9A7
MATPHRSTTWCVSATGAVLRGKELDHLDPRPDNYRDYSEAALGRVQQIRELLNAGLSTQAIRAILPCLQSPRDPIVFKGDPRRWRLSNESVTV